MTASNSASQSTSLSWTAASARWPGSSPPAGCPRRGLRFSVSALNLPLASDTA